MTKMLTFFIGIFLVTEPLRHFSVMQKIFFVYLVTNVSIPSFSERRCLFINVAEVSTLFSSKQGTQKCEYIFPLSRLKILIFVYLSIQK
jgi:hypothetical protein